MAIKMIEWKLDTLQNIYGHLTTVHGSPKVVDCPFGKALEFDGQQDAIYIDTNPLAGLSRFTVEVIFRPDTNGLEEQRFLYIGEIHGDRFMFEIRLTGNGQWFVDNYLCWRIFNKTLYNDKSALYRSMNSRSSCFRWP